MGNSKTVNILIVGVGGQGTILASRILSYLAMEDGHDVKVSEIHGMAQRGGSVVTQVRMGKKVYSPLISEGQADIILAFEKLEALRWVHCLKTDGTIIINTQAIDPVPVMMGIQEYPDGIVCRIKGKVLDTIAVDALHMAEECGNAKASNVVLMGVLARKMGFGKEKCIRALEEKVPFKFLELNKNAFEMGWNLQV
ncbi:indolepyruvate oxidoreductase subunit beta [Phosphitispora sp. TUW77]|uniref:indolepyruvate oxidoreductase subunit beta n=1 Tax=Phosphitispora sp. TUW77 TaxID=3152361 RepID=UPI003AB6EF8F